MTYDEAVEKIFSLGGNYQVHIEFLNNVTNEPVREGLGLVFETYDEIVEKMPQFRDMEEKVIKQLNCHCSYRYYKLDRENRTVKEFFL